MSGFLRRVASGVLHQQRAIHPAVGAMWSAAGMHRHGTGEPIEFSSEVLVPPPPTRSAATSGSESHLNLRPRPERGGLVPGNTEQENAEWPGLEAAVAFRPLVDAARWMDASAGRPAPQADETDPPSDHILATSSERTGSHRIDALRPLIKPRATGAITKSPPLLQSKQPAQSLREEPDTIEIHIGRIEVQAATPRTVQPATPRPARKSLDLREYLGRERRPR